MRAYRQGSLYRVTVSAAEVSGFARRWPCFGERRALSFTFDRLGDLVDVSEGAGMDERGVCVLSEEAGAYGARRLQIDTYIPRGAAAE